MVANDFYTIRETLVDHALKLRVDSTWQMARRPCTTLVGHPQINVVAGNRSQKVNGDWLWPMPRSGSK